MFSNNKSNRKRIRYIIEKDGKILYSQQIIQAVWLGRNEEKEDLIKLQVKLCSKDETSQYIHHKG